MLFSGISEREEEESIERSMRGDKPRKDFNPMARVKTLKRQLQDCQSVMGLDDEIALVGARTELEELMQEIQREPACSLFSG